MPKRETKMPLRPWSRPAFHRMASGAAESAGDVSVDGSASLS
ncbi:MAG: hypothetical protein ABWX67_12080 [Allosphingosinicella sp.]